MEYCIIAIIIAIVILFYVVYVHFKKPEQHLSGIWILDDKRKEEFGLNQFVLYLKK